MIRSNNRGPKPAPKTIPAPLHAGVEVVQPPKSAARRDLLCGPDIQTSGGGRSAHSRSTRTR